MTSVTRAPAPRAGAPSEGQRVRVIPVASLPRRVAGAAIDAIIIMVISGLLMSWLRPSGSPVQVRIDAVTGERVVIGGPGVFVDLVGWIPAILTAAYMITLIALWGRTPGGWSVGIRCIRADNGGRPGWGVASRRWLVLFGLAAATSLVPVIGPWAWLITVVVGFSPLLDRSGWLRGFHDRFAGDLVIRQQ